MQEIWRYCKGHTRKCAGCIIRIKLFWGKVILTWTQKWLWLVWFVYEMDVWISLPLNWINVKRKKKNTTRNSITFKRWHKSEQSMEAEWWFFLYDQSDINFVKGNDIFVCSQFVRSHWYHAVQIIHNIYLFFGGR